MFTVEIVIKIKNVIDHALLAYIMYTNLLSSNIDTQNYHYNN